MTAPPPPAPERRGLRRGIYVLPTLFTVANVFCGFLSIVRTFDGDFRFAAFLLFLAALCDSLDGRIARLTKTTSEFGEQYDSLADVLSFGIAPALLAWRWGMADLGRWGLLASFVFLICGSMRLARFNIMVHRVDKRWFVGLPIPAGAGVVACLVFWRPEPIGPSSAERPWQIAWAVLVAFVAFLMISTIRYRSFKDVDLRKRRPVFAVFFMAVILGLLVAETERFLAGVACIYAISGPAGKLFGLFRRRPADPPDTESEAQP